MDLSPNFAFLQPQFPLSAEGATLAERHADGDPRGACFHARHAVERLVKRLYKIEKALPQQEDQRLDSLLKTAEFKGLVPSGVWMKCDYIRKKGNGAVHGRRAPKPEVARELVVELAHVLYWAGRTYLRDGAKLLEGYAYDEALLGQGGAVQASSSEELKALEAKLAKSDEEREALAAKNEDLERELEKTQAAIEAIKAANQSVGDTHDYDEATTRERLIDVELARAGWELRGPHDREYPVVGMPNEKGKGYVDYVLWGDDGKPLAVVEAKRTSKDPAVGKQQAKLYADCLEEMHGRRPMIYYTNGYETLFWDDETYPPRRVLGFHKKAELESLLRRRGQAFPTGADRVDGEIAGRYYQKRAIASLLERFASKHRAALLVMATGTGKTRTAIALVKALQGANRVKRVLFLADRTSLVKQAVNAFKTHLPESSPVNLVTDKEGQGRVHVSTYHTMMGLIDQMSEDQSRYGVGHYDLVILDEAHRSIYRKFGAIFRYFDSLLVGLTATPRDQVDRNTYKLFGLEPGMPTDSYELEKAVTDGFLVPPRAQRVDMRFPRDGIEYDDLSPEEKEEWDEIDWGEGGDPGRVSPAAVNNWLFNTDTVDKVLRYLMEHGHRVQGGDRLAKTIVFARKHDHAAFIQERFDHHYPEWKGKFARVIDYQNTYAQSLIDDFSVKDGEPHIAISVDMLDTGIDIPEVANLVFFKPVYSRVKFWQMIGRGTRLCPDLFGPGEHKQDFRVFDFCGNFQFFNENPQGIEGGNAVTLGTKLFRSRLQLVAGLQQASDQDPEDALGRSVRDLLHAEVAGMNADNFLVREHAETVSAFTNREAWDQLSEADRDRLGQWVAGLPSSVEMDGHEARQFDLIALTMQLSLLSGDSADLEQRRQRVIEMASMLEEKVAIPAVKAEIAYLQGLQEPSFWEGIDLAGLEELRQRVRGLVQFLDRTKRNLVYTDFQDEVIAVHQEEAVDVPKMTSPQYEKKVLEFLEEHKDLPVLSRLREGQSLSPDDLRELERVLIDIGEEDGQELLEHWISRHAAPSLPYLIRRFVGMDRSAAQELFAEFLGNRSLNSSQIRFIEMVIEQLTAHGILEASALYEPPFTHLHSEGPDALFTGHEDVVSNVFDRLKEVREVLTAV